MNPGSDLVEALVQICVDNSIFCAHFSGTGYLAAPQLRSYNMAARGFDPTVNHDGTFHVVSLHGNVSLRDRQTVVRIHVVGTLLVDDEEPQLLSGELVGGEIVSLEFSLSTIDDIRLYRADDDRTGLDPWLHMDLSTGTLAPHDQDRELPLLPTAPGLSTASTEADDSGQNAGTNSPSSAKGGKSGGSSASDVEISAGDWLDHPTLGTCRVLTTDEDDHVSIELESGRRVELHLGLIQLTPQGKHDKGGNRFSVSVARRR